MRAIAIISIKTAKFPLGQIAITANAQARLDPIDVQQGLSRHAAGDWGDVGSEDACLNDAALKHNHRLLSVFGKGDRCFWIITEWDRSVTTALMPEDH
jgi:hypothetical protein